MMSVRVTEMSELSSDLIEAILWRLPIPSLVRAATVCRLWYSIIASPSLGRRHPHPPWFFLYGFHNISAKNDQSFAFDPLSQRWLLLPCPLPPSSSSLTASAGFFFLTAPRFSFSPALPSPSLWRPAPALHFPRTNPLVGVFYRDEHPDPCFIVAAGVNFIGNLVDMEEERLEVEMYDPGSKSWVLGPPLPSPFRSANSSLSLSSALFEGKFYVVAVSSSLVSSFDLRAHVWSPVRALRPPAPALVLSFLVASTHALVLAGVRNAPSGPGPSFHLWKLHPSSMELSEMALMPPPLLSSLFDSYEEEHFNFNFGSLKCVGLGDYIYVFNDHSPALYPACLCHIDTASGRCSWRRLPPLPFPVNKFHKVASFSSAPSLHSILPPPPPLHSP